jgi:hypothetical protein
VRPDVPNVKEPSGSYGTSLDAATHGMSFTANINIVSDLLKDFPGVVNAGKTLPAGVGWSLMPKFLAPLWPPDSGS